MILAYFLTRSLISPIEALATDMDSLREKKIYDELRPFVETIKKQHEDILQNARIRQEFTANVSHELKTPLTAISGYSELIENRMAEGEAAVRFAKEIHHSSNRLLTLINDVIHLSELDSMQLEETKEMVDLRGCQIMCRYVTITSRETSSEFGPIRCELSGAFHQTENGGAGIQSL